MSKYILSLLLLIFITMQGTAYEFDNVRRIIKVNEPIRAVEKKATMFKNTTFKTIGYSYQIRLDVKGLDHLIFYDNEKERDKDYDRVLNELKQKED